MKTEFKALGIDVSKANITTHTLSCFPAGGIKNYWNKTRGKSSLYPTFYTFSNKRKTQDAFDFADYVTNLAPNFVVLEPTGNHYSRIWHEVLQRLEVKILWVGHVELKRYRAGKLLPNKSDAADALAMAAYALDPEHLTELGGDINPKFYLIHQPEPINQLRDLCQQLEHLARVQSPIINYSRQLLSWQFPEVAHRNSKATKYGNIPPLWGWLANRSITPAQKTILDKKFGESIAKQYHFNPDFNLRQHASWLCDIALFEQDIEAEISQIINKNCFQQYIEVFDKFGFGLRIKARLLTRIYPFEAFLVNGKPLIEHEMKGKRRVKYNRTRNTFKMRLGMGTTSEQSGDMTITKAGGSGLCRMSFWQYVLTRVETGSLPNTEVAKKLIDYRDLLKNSPGKLKGKHLQSKLMSKTCNLLYIELVKSLVS